jgi:[ribosomal protein S5]-alanine N-acetyltransferase
MLRVPFQFSAGRLTFRPPELTDAELMWKRYASDPEVTKYLAWPRHQTPEPTRAFIQLAQQSWTKDGMGPWLVFENGELVGSTGLDWRSGDYAMTGYLLVKSAWGRGLATEILTAMVEQARAAKLSELRACVHPDNAVSIHILEKCGLARFDAEPTAMFPNLDATNPLPVLHYKRAL